MRTATAWASGWPHCPMPVLVLPGRRRARRRVRRARRARHARPGTRRKRGRKATRSAARSSDIVASRPKTPAPAITYYYELEPDYYSVTSSTFVGRLLGLLGHAGASPTRPRTPRPPAATRSCPRSTSSRRIRTTSCWPTPSAARPSAATVAKRAGLVGDHRRVKGSRCAVERRHRLALGPAHRRPACKTVAGRGEGLAGRTAAMGLSRRRRPGAGTGTRSRARFLIRGRVLDAGKPRPWTFVLAVTSADCGDARGVSVGPAAIPFGTVLQAAANHLPLLPHRPRARAGRRHPVAGAAAAGRARGSGRRDARRGRRRAYQGVFRNPLADPYLLGDRRRRRARAPPS